MAVGVGWTRICDSSGGSGGGAANSVEHDLVWPYDYIGVAPNGSLTSASVWTITRTEMFIDGTVNITQAVNVAWDDHLTETYS